MRGHSYWVYIVASGPCGWLYVGMTNDLVRRIAEHKHGQIDGYSRERGTDQFVWYEHHRYVDQAIRREKQIKRWLRPWKFQLVEAMNPHWTDLDPASATRPPPFTQPDRNPLSSRPQRSGEPGRD